VFHGEGIDAMQTAGQASIWASIGLALLAPALVRSVTVRIGGAVERRTGVSGYLSALNIRQRGQQMATALMPIIAFTGIATGTLGMQSIENAAAPVAGTATTAAEASNIETLNLVVVGAAAILTLASSLAAARRMIGVPAIEAVAA
jgi:putative ABC transport system permease protein